MDAYNKSDVKSWLEICLKNKNLCEIVVQNISYEEKKEGATGDIVFVDVQAEDSNGSPKIYNLVLKCSKNSKLIREASFASPMFLNEIYFYENVLAALQKFEKEKGIKNPFDSLPKYYGSYLSDDREVIALENVSKSGYSLWNKAKPMTLTHIKLIIKEYARLHATSAAMGSQNPTANTLLLQPLNRLFDNFEQNANDFGNICFQIIGEMYDLLQGDLNETILLKWKEFGEKSPAAMFGKMKDLRGFKIVTHGDCWNNNFMFQTDENNKDIPMKVTILDWQIAKISTPVTDLALFLFSCISEKDLENLEEILNDYHNHFLETLLELKTDSKMYTKEQFWYEWKNYSRYGIMLVPITLKVCLRDEDTAIDISEAAKKGSSADAYKFDVRNKELLKKRIKPVVKYVVENNLV